MATSIPVSGIPAKEFLEAPQNYLEGHLQYFYHDGEDEITVVNMEDLFGIRYTLAENADLMIFLDPFYAQYCVECRCLNKGKHTDVPDDALVCDCA
jgi:hypothetical protein